jgi:transcriptional regulator NrdR family protein
MRDGSVKCPKCGARSKVIDSRPSNDKQKTIRRRECRICKNRFKTIEIPEHELEAIKESLNKHKNVWSLIAAMIEESL